MKMTFNNVMEAAKSDKRFGGMIFKKIGTDHFCLTTDTNEYYVSTNSKETYLGCIVNAVRPLPGENYCRGMDLHDGKMEEGTWTKIISDILCYEKGHPKGCTKKECRD